MVLSGLLARLDLEDRATPTQNASIAPRLSIGV
jgi:hypothetical protein